MNAPVIADAIDTTLRTYARASTTRISVIVGSTFLVTLSVEAMLAACELAVRGLQRAHPVVQLAALGMAIGAVVHPGSRGKLLSAWHSTKPALLVLIGDVVRQLGDAVKTADDAQEDLRHVVPVPRKRSLLVHARAVCLMARQPLPLDAIERRIRADGYVSHSRNLKGYVRHVLRSSGEFIEVRPGVWTITVD
jgi:hypothetical protein